MRNVIAVDPTLRKISVSVVSDDGGTPKVSSISSRELKANKSPRANLIRMRAHMDKAVDLITAYEPELVVMVSGIMGDLRRDSSAPRRLGLWWMLADRLDAADLKVAEVPIMSVQKLWLGTAKWGRPGTDALAAVVRATWPDVKEPQDYRLTTVAAAAVGALCRDIEVPAFTPAVADWREALRNKGGSWPWGMQPWRQDDGDEDEDLDEELEGEEKSA